MLIKLTGSLVGIATSAFLIQEKTYAKDINNADADACPAGGDRAPYKKIHTPKSLWDFNWDRRDPAAIYANLTDPPGDKCEIPHRSRHLYLIRHGQYLLKGEKAEDKKLTELGRKQAELTGQRLKNLNVTFDKVFISTMTRAVETGEIILGEIPSEKVKGIEYSALLPEGSPVPPEPPMAHTRPAQDYFRDGARIEAAFRKFFHRADPSQKENEHVLLVCHANVIRYLVCRALQIPEEAWLRFSLKNGSITHIEIRPSGRVIARGIGEAGFMPQDMITTT